MRICFLSIASIFLFLSSFSLFSQVPANDDRINAEELVLDAQGNFETANNAYSLVGATADGATPPNWYYGVNHNVWFKFRPTVPLVNFVLKGTVNKMAALYDSAGNVLQSKMGPYDGYLGMIFEELDTLQEYYLNIDGRTASGFGIKMSSEIGFDYKSHAEELVLDAQGNFETANNAYSLVGATADGATPPNWYYGVNHNVWFKFRPTVPLVNFVLKGTVNKMAALYDSAGNVLQSKMGPYDGYLGMIFEELDTLQEYYLNIDGRTASGFGIKMSSEIGFDYKSHAEELVLDAQGNFETANNAYSLVGATADGATPPNWYYGVNHNVWFKFRPTVPLVNFVLKGTVNKMAALYDSAGNVLQSKMGPYDGYLGMIFEELDTLQEYYLNIDGRTASGFGIKMSSEIGFDYKSHAEELVLDAQGNFETANNAYSLVGATADGATPPNWYYGVNHNVWFKFRPTVPLVNFVLKGTVNKMAALYDSAGNVLQSKTGPYDGYLEMIFEGLDPLQEYYLNIDGRTASSFGIEVKPGLYCKNELWAISSGAWNDPSTWSDTEGGQPVSAIPCEETVVYIKGFDVSFNSTGTVVAKRLELIGTSSSVMTRLNVQTGELNVVEKIITSGAGVKLQSSTSSTIKVIGAGGG